MKLRLFVLSSWFVCAAAGAQAPALPPAHPPEGTRIAALATGIMKSRAGLSYSGGSLREARDFMMGAILVQHPQGALLIDAGFGRNVDRQFAEATPWLMRQLSSYQKKTPIAQLLTQSGVDPKSLAAVILTHAHWDHVSGLDDLRGVPVWLSQRELAFVRSDEEGSLLARQLHIADFRAYEFRDGPYLGFAHSYDVYGDGSVVLVPAAGHTPGSIIAFVATSDGARYAFIGDLAWQIEGVEQVAPRPWLIRGKVDVDPDATLALLQRMHDLKQQFPSLIVVPAHDARVWAKLPTLR